MRDRPCLHAPTGRTLESTRHQRTENSQALNGRGGSSPPSGAHAVVPRCMVASTNRRRRICCGSEQGAARTQLRPVASRVATIICTMDLERLRRETRAEHDATEEVMPLMSAALTLPQYVGVLQRLQQVVCGWEQWAQDHVPADLADLVRSRRRGSLLDQDLEWARSAGSSVSGLAPPTLPALHLEPQSRASFLGAMYVMEGSTLGGQYIARHLESVLNLHPGFGDAYFRGYGNHTGEMWRSFKAILTEVPEPDTETVITAAIAMYRWFRQAMLAEPVQPEPV